MLRVDHAVEAVGTQDLGMDATVQLVDAVVLPPGQHAVESVFREPEAIDLSDVESVRTVLNALFCDAGNAAIMGRKDVGRSGDKGQRVVVRMDEGNRVPAEPMPDAVPLPSPILGFPEVDPAGHNAVRVERVHGEGEVVESLTTEVRSAHRVAQEVGHIGNLRVGRSTVRAQVESLQSLGAGPGGHRPHLVWRSR